MDTGPVSGGHFVEEISPHRNNNKRREASAAKATNLCISRAVLLICVSLFNGAVNNSYRTSSVKVTSE